MAVYVTPEARKKMEESNSGPGVQGYTNTNPNQGYYVDSEGSSPSGYNVTGASPTYNAGTNYGSLASRYQSKMIQAESNKPGAYQSQYTDQINAILDSITNREKFSYSAGDDPLYQQYRESYMHNGQKAMRDTMGQAAALTGGYGSTAATTAASQAYDEYMNALNDKIPELYQLAYNQYLNEGQDMYNQLGAVQSVDNTEYNRYRDTVSDYYNDLNYYSGMYNAETDRGMSADQFAQQMAYNQQKLENDNYWTQQTFDYQKEQDALAQQNWQTTFDYNKEQDALKLALQRAQLAKSGSYRGGDVDDGPKEIERGSFDDAMLTANRIISDYEYEDGALNSLNESALKYKLKKAGYSDTVAQRAATASLEQYGKKSKGGK